jgi:hypothetical protein
MSGGQGSPRASSILQVADPGDEPNLTQRRTTVKLIPAVFFQKKLNGVEAAAKTPERLEVFESELRAVVGGALRAGAAVGRAIPTGGPDGSGGTTTYSGSAGWLDVMQADDCTY